MAENKKTKKKDAQEKAQNGFTLSVLDASGKEVGTVELDGKVFNGQVNLPLMHQVTTMYLANKRQGTAATKTRAFVSGGNSKPWRQKGTGRARTGSSRSPIWRKGGIVFGPHPRDYSYQMPKKMKKKALLSSLNARLNDNLVKVLEELKVDSGRTKDFCSILQKLKLNKKTLFILNNPAETVLRSSRNIRDVMLKRAEGINALDVLLHNNIVITKEALNELTARLRKGD